MVVPVPVLRPAHQAQDPQGGVSPAQGQDNREVHPEQSLLLPPAGQEERDALRRGAVGAGIVVR